MPVEVETMLILKNVKTDTPQEMAELAMLMGSQVATAAKSFGPMGGGVIALQQQGDEFRDSVRRLLESLNQTQSECIAALAASAKPLSDEEIRERVNKASNKGLGGVLGAISKHAAKAGLQLEEVIVTTKKDPKAYRLADKFAACYRLLNGN